MSPDECPLVVYRLTEVEKDIVKIDKRVDRHNDRLESIEHWRISLSAKIALAAGAGSLVGGSIVTALIQFFAKG